MLPSPIYFLSVKKSDQMENSDLLFFCKTCKDRSAAQLSGMTCDIPHVVKKHRKGDYVAYQGDRVSHLLLLTKGKVKTEIVSSSGFSLPMEEISAPSPLAAAFLFADNNRFPVDVIAMEECEVIHIKKVDVEKQMAICPGFLRGFMAFNANIIQQISERLKIFAQKGIKSKLVYYIMARESDGSFELGRNISALAEYFNVERPSLSRAISEMVKDGLIEYDGGKGKIINHKGLNELLQ